MNHLMECFPETNFRLHANVRVDSTLRKLDASTYSEDTDWYYRDIAKYTHDFGSSGYSFHAGKREHASLEKMRENIVRIQDYFSCPVIVEGLYPTRKDTLLVSNWEEYSWLLESGLFYAIDLSHINILSVFSNIYEEELLFDLLTNSKCREIHISHNCGRRDAHHLIRNRDWETIWWRDIWLKSMSKRSHDLPLHFTEGNQKRRR